MTASLTPHLEGIECRKPSVLVLGHGRRRSTLALQDLARRRLKTNKIDLGVPTPLDRAPETRLSHNPGPIRVEESEAREDEREDAGQSEATVLKFTLHKRGLRESARVDQEQASHPPTATPQWSDDTRQAIEWPRHRRTSRQPSRADSLPSSNGHYHTTFGTGRRKLAHYGGLEQIEGRCTRGSTPTFWSEQESLPRLHKNLQLRRRPNHLLAKPGGETSTLPWETQVCTVS